MTGLLPCTCSATCQADRTCQLPPRFQARLDAPPHAQQPHVHRRLEACASHAGAMVAAITRWAREHGVTEADLTILAVDPPASPGLPGQPPQPTGRTRGLVISTVHFASPSGQERPGHHPDGQAFPAECGPLHRPRAPRLRPILSTPPDQ